MHCGDTTRPPTDRQTDGQTDRMYKQSLLDSQCMRLTDGCVQRQLSPSPPKDDTHVNSAVVHRDSNSSSCCFCQKNCHHFCCEMQTHNAVPTRTDFLVREARTTPRTKKSMRVATAQGTVVVRDLQVKGTLVRMVCAKGFLLFTGKRVWA